MGEIVSPRLKSLKLRVHPGTLAFVDVFSNEQTGKTSFALIKEGERIFGADNAREGYIRPFKAPENHCFLPRDVFWGPAGASGGVQGKMEIG